MKALRSLLVAVLSLSLAASAANAVTVVVSDDHGGILPLYQARCADLGAKNVSVEIVGPCVSACAVLFGYIPSQKICVTPDASLGFHLATMQFAAERCGKRILTLSATGSPNMAASRISCCG